MSIDKHGRYPTSAFNPADPFNASTTNPSHHIVWDLTPDGGKQPRKLSLDVTSAKEYVERDPGRYIYGSPDETEAPGPTAKTVAAENSASFERMKTQAAETA